MGHQLALSLAVLVVAIILILRRRRRSLLPPGPPGVPIVGNAFDIPRSECAWFKYTKWSHEYSEFNLTLVSSCMLDLGLVLDSDLISLNIVGTPVVVINSAEAAIELLDKRSSIYSDR